MDLGTLLGIIIAIAGILIGQAIEEDLFFRSFNRPQP